MGEVVDSIVGGVSDALGSVSDVVEQSVPGGWGTVAGAATGLGALSGLGGAIGASAADLAAADAAQLAAQGLSESAIAETLGTTYGMDAMAAADMAGLAVQGMPASTIAQSSSLAGLSNGAAGIGSNVGVSTGSLGGLQSMMNTVGQLGQAAAPWAGMAQSAYQAAKAGDYATMADPFRTQRPMYQGMLQNLMTNPSAINMDPSYQWRFNQGLEAINRSAGARGMLGSGNRLAELTQYGQGMASQEFGNQFNRLQQLSGASTGQPGMAAQIAYQVPQSNMANIFSQLGNVSSPQYQQNLSNLWA